MDFAAGYQHFADGAPFAEIALRHPSVREVYFPWVDEPSGRPKLGFGEEDDKEELALTLNGKKSKIKADDFIKAAATLGLPENVMPNLFAKYKAIEEKFIICIMDSFLEDELKDAYIKMISSRINKL